MIRATQFAALMGVLACGGLFPAAMAEEPPASTFVLLKQDGACDAENARVWLANQHGYKTISTKVRWRAAGGRDLTDEFFAAPNSLREIGCAADAEILEVAFAEF